jgi:uncharacterized protein YbaR (Trm112 family)
MSYLLWRFYILIDDGYYSYDRDSPYLATKNNRFKINNLTWTSSYAEKSWCKPCYSSGLGRLIPSPKADEKDKLYCRNCGKSYNISDIDKQQQEQKNLTATSAKSSGPIVISQKSKNKRDKPKFDIVNNELTDEDLEDLRGLGFRI